MLMLRSKVYQRHTLKREQMKIEEIEEENPKPIPNSPFRHLRQPRHRTTTNLAPLLTFRDDETSRIIP